MTRRPGDIGRMAENFGEMQKRQRRRDALSQILFLFLFGLGAACSLSVFLLISHIFRSL